MNAKSSLPALFLLLGLGAAIGCGTSGDEASRSSASTISAAACAAASAWAEGTSYATGALVTFGGATYSCVQSHTSQADWTPAAVPALWAPVSCGGGGGSSGGGSSGGSSSGAGGGAGTCDANAWVYMATDANACAGHVGESCGWTATNGAQGYHCQATSWGTGCEPGGATCPGGGGAGGSSGGGGGGGSGSSSGGGSGDGTGNAGAVVFSPYKDTSINMNWNTNVITTTISGAPTALAADLTQNGGKAVTLAFATGECGSENWGGVPGAAMASANAGLLGSAGVKYILSTGGAAGSFSCGSDAGMTAFINRWASPGLIGIDFDIEAGQSQGVITDLITRIKSAHATFPGLRFSLTLATLAVSESGQTTARSLGASAQDSFNVYGDETMNAVKSVLGFNGSGASWPSYVTVNLMTMDFGGGSPGVCVVAGSTCQMGQSSIQAAFNLHDKWGVPYANIELTPMIGGNDVASEQFTLSDTDAVSRFAVSQGLAGVHYWSYDRDTDCPAGSASPTCNSIGGAGAHGFLKRFLSNGLK